ncbi:hypothetical protein CEUSTIGMA_g9085.t1 [Chlamydomonas eustigma]|uniref:C3H1-type domain-containing protein n=1 Tax=Chlamydomonas eustigma TaxID=1157962 RepID=A0A250XF13_9CHLO|nr:hypothetical protein CEUSTIGMA_g9085.t1 [Chlamydomonas eustigma]|eukprot:GAX81657.1 hypothetical protein CEUSTIGMA_g9085.t1 [Chlamydomonas eustigma]
MAGSSKGNGDVCFDLDAAAFSSDEFRVFQFKVKRCPRARPHDWTQCPFAHPGEKAKRRDPKKFQYSGTACPEYRTNGSCRRGDTCPLAHGVFECWLHPSRYRTQMCTDGAACKRRVCFFAHLESELRKADSLDDSSWYQHQLQSELQAEQQIQQQLSSLRTLTSLLTAASGQAEVGSSDTTLVPLATLLGLIQQQSRSQQQTLHVAPEPLQYVDGSGNLLQPASAVQPSAVQSLPSAEQSPGSGGQGVQQQLSAMLQQVHVSMVVGNNSAPPQQGQGGHENAYRLHTAEAQVARLATEGSNSSVKLYSGEGGASPARLDSGSRSTEAEGMIPLKSEPMNRVPETDIAESVNAQGWAGAHWDNQEPPVVAPEVPERADIAPRKPTDEQIVTAGKQGVQAAGIGHHKEVLLQLQQQQQEGGILGACLPGSTIVPLQQEVSASANTSSSSSSVHLQQQQAASVATMLGVKQLGRDSEEAQMLAAIFSSLAGRPELLASAKALLDGLQVLHNTAGTAPAPPSPAASFSAADTRTGSSTSSDVSGSSRDAVNDS